MSSQGLVYQTYMSNNGPLDYDELHGNGYDPDYTADISSKMRVPDKLNLGTDRNDYLAYEEVGRANIDMKVPEKIIVAGAEQYNGVRHEPKLNFDGFEDPITMINKARVSLSTPPRTLTLEEQSFPMVGAATPAPPKASQAKAGSSEEILTVITEEEPELSEAGDGLLMQIDGDVDDVTALRRQVSRLNRQMRLIQADNARRTQREMVLYPVVFGYILVQACRWLFARQ